MHGMKTPSPRMGTLYSFGRQWFVTKIHVLRLVLFVPRQFKRWGSISNTTLGPSDHGKKPPSSRLGTLYSHWRQWFMTKIHVLRLVSFVRRQFKRCLSISNTTLGPSGYRTKPPSSRLRTLYGYYRQWFMTKWFMCKTISLNATSQIVTRAEMCKFDNKIGILYVLWHCCIYRYVFFFLVFFSNVVSLFISCSSSFVIFQIIEFDETHILIDYWYILISCK